jgi:hypothetical protein
LDGWLAQKKGKKWKMMKMRMTKKPKRKLTMTIRATEKRRAAMIAKAIGQKLGRMSPQ